jgi:cell division protein FtsI (penicillin-binding protein 3)
VVEDGTGTQAQIPGYKVAGKTGTAKKLVNGSYRGHSDYNVSFVGFVPARKPAFTIIVVVDSPHARGVSPYGGTVAAPIFQRIADAALRYSGIAPSVNAPPPVLVARHDETRAHPTAGPADAPALIALRSVPSGQAGVFPDLTGMGAREALRVLARLGLTAKLEGTGLVEDQEPAAGTPIDASTVVATLWLKRHTAERLTTDARP